MIARARCLVVASCLTVWFVPTASTAAGPPPLNFAPARPTDSEIVHVTVLGEAAGACGAYFLPYVDSAASRVTLYGYRSGPPAPCPQPWWSSHAAIGQLRAGAWEVQAWLDGQPYATTSLTVEASPTLVAIGSFEYFGTNFRIQVEWRDPRNGQVAKAPGLALSDRAAQFWFFDPGNPEVTVKILDGRTVNDHHWLFASTLSTVELTLRVTECIEGDPPSCSAPREYHVPAGTGLDVVDLRAF